jgi:hypothetical protein
MVDAVEFSLDVSHFFHEGEMCPYIGFGLFRESEDKTERLTDSVFPAGSGAFNSCLTVNCFQNLFQLYVGA